jgi:hypothetical protein
MGLPLTAHAAASAAEMMTHVGMMVDYTGSADSMQADGA